MFSGKGGRRSVLINPFVAPINSVHDEQPCGSPLSYLSYSEYLTVTPSIVGRWWMVVIKEEPRFAVPDPTVLVDHYIGPRKVTIDPGVLFIT